MGSEMCIRDRSKAFATQRQLPLHLAGKSGHPDVVSQIHLPPWAQFLWVKGHLLGLKGNDWADVGAKKALQLPLVCMPAELGDVMD